MHLYFIGKMGFTMDGEEVLVDQCMRTALFEGCDTIMIDPPSGENL